MKEDSLKVFCDGGARGNPGPAACAFVVYSRGEIIFKQAFFLGKATNNIAEYSAVINALSWIKKNPDVVGDSHIHFFLDSELVVRQLSMVYKVKNENLKKLFVETKTIEGLLKNKIIYNHVYRSKNAVADELLNLELDLH
jgi:ribonuclease HI